MSFLVFFWFLGGTALTKLGYTTEVLEDAQLYASHAEKSDVDLEDVRLAIQSRVNLSFTNPPPREVVSLLFSVSSYAMGY